MSPRPAFALATPLPRPRLQTQTRLPRRPPRPHVAKAVLDTPASNTYLQRHAEAVLRDFLTRRAVHTVMYYMAELHDRPSAHWLSAFDAFDARVKADTFRDGDAFLNRMLRAPRETATLQVGHPRFSRTYTFTIDPYRIATRVIRSREHLAAEWARDLRCVEAENLEIQRIGFERLLCKDEAELDATRNLVFDSDPFANDATPLRYKNYVALKTLITQHAIARLLPYTRDRGPNHEYMYLLSFVNSYGPIANGDDFVRALMARPIEARTNPVHTILPRAIALQVLELRTAIAEEWIAVMEYVPQEQRVMARNILERSVNLSDAPGEDVRRPKSGAEDPKPSFDKDGEESGDQGL